MSEAPEHVRVAIIGAGFSGLGLAIRLRQAGIGDVAILEKALEVGGTWRENTPRASPATCPRTCTRCRSRPTRAGRGCSPPARRHVRGRGGQVLAERRQGSPSAHLGATVAGFPNLFLMVGPNTGLGHTSIVLMIELQIAHILDALRLMDARSVDTVEVTDEAQAAFNEVVDARLAGSVWNAGGCSSCYLDDAGRNSSIWPGSTLTYRLRTRRFDASRYRATRPVSPAG